MRLVRVCRARHAPSAKASICFRSIPLRIVTLDGETSGDHGQLLLEETPVSRRHGFAVLVHALSEVTHTSLLNSNTVLLALIDVSTDKKEGDCCSAAIGVTWFNVITGADRNSGIEEGGADCCSAAIGVTWFNVVTGADRSSW